VTQRGSAATKGFDLFPVVPSEAGWETYMAGKVGPGASAG
jgi:hypothetical protein